MKKRDHISQYLKQAHILPIKFRIKYKSCLFVYKILHGISPQYLEDMAFLRFPSEMNLRSNNDDWKVEVSAPNRTIQYTMINNWQNYHTTYDVYHPLMILKQNWRLIILVSHFLDFRYVTCIAIFDNNNDSIFLSHVLVVLRDNLIHTMATALRPKGQKLLLCVFALGNKAVNESCYLSLYDFTKVLK